jgi:hypothetical protein
VEDSHTTDAGRPSWNVPSMKLRGSARSPERDRALTRRSASIPGSAA